MATLLASADAAIESAPAAYEAASELASKASEGIGSLYVDLQAGEQSVGSYVRGIGNAVWNNKGSIIGALTGAGGTAFGVYEHYQTRVSEELQDEANKDIINHYEKAAAVPSLPVPVVPPTVYNTNTNPIYNVATPSIPVQSGSVLQSNAYQGASIP